MILVARESILAFWLPVKPIRKMASMIFSANRGPRFGFLIEDLKKSKQRMLDIIKNRLPTSNNNNFVKIRVNSCLLPESTVGKIISPGDIAALIIAKDAFGYVRKNCTTRRIT